MANEVKLEILTFEIKASRAENHVPLSNVEGQDFYDLFMEYLSTLDILEINEGQKSAMRLKEATLTLDSKKRTIRGFFESGHYGFESEFENIKTRAKKKKQIDDVEKIPFYFLIYIPHELNVGIIILQRFGINGIHTVFKASLGKFIRERFSKLRLEMNGFVSKELAKSFLQDGGIREIVLTRFNLPSDRTDRLGLTQYQNDILSLEVRIKAKRTHWFKGLNSKIRKFVSHPDANFFNTKELRALGFDGSHKISVVSKLHGSKRTIDLSETGQIKPYYDIESGGNLIKDRTGHPKFNSIDTIACEMLNEFKGELKKK